MGTVKEIRIVHYVTDEEMNVKGGVEYPTPTNYLSEVDALPLAFRQELISNSWMDESGLVVIRSTYHPRPVRGTDGNVYLLSCNADLEDKAWVAYLLTEAQTLLGDGEVCETSKTAA